MDGRRRLWRAVDGFRWLFYRGRTDSWQRETAAASPRQALRAALDSDSASQRPASCARRLSLCSDDSLWSAASILCWKRIQMYAIRCEWWWEGDMFGVVLTPRAEACVQ